MTLVRIVDKGMRKVRAKNAEKSLGEVIGASSLPTQEKRELLAKLRPVAKRSGESEDETASGPDATQALERMVEFIPADIVTLYVASCSAAAALAAIGIDRLRLYLGFVVATPIVFVLIYLGKRRANYESLSFKVGDFPYFRLFAATIAFSVWALAVPGTLPDGQEVVGPLAALGAILVSSLLSILEPLFGIRPPKPAD